MPRQAYCGGGKRYTVQHEVMAETERAHLLCLFKGLLAPERDNHQYRCATAKKKKEEETTRNEMTCLPLCTCYTFPSSYKLFSAGYATTAQPHNRFLTSRRIAGPGPEVGWGLFKIHKGVN